MGQSKKQKVMKHLLKVQARVPVGWAVCTDEGKFNLVLENKDGGFEHTFDNYQDGTLEACLEVVKMQENPPEYLDKEPKVSKQCGIGCTAPKSIQITPYDVFSSSGACSPGILAMAEKVPNASEFPDMVKNGKLTEKGVLAYIAGEVLADRAMLVQAMTLGTTYTKDLLTKHVQLKMLEVLVDIRTLLTI